MSMGSNVIGIKTPDEHWQRMRDIWDACQAAGVQVPEEVERFFNYEPPDEKGILVKLAFPRHPCLREWSNAKKNAQGYEIDLTKLPSDIKTLRFYVSW